MIRQNSSAVADLTILPMSPRLGAEVSGIDLRTGLTPERRALLRTLLFQHGVLVFRDQALDTAGHVAFAEAFGPILVFTSVVDPEPARPGVHEVHGGSVGWHFDASSLPAPPVATVLRAVRVPAEGNDTLWASGVAAYQALAPELRALATGRYVTHGRGVVRGPDDERPVVAHRLVRRHPHTGEHYLYINLPDWDSPLVLGMSPDDSDALVAELRAAYLRPEHQIRLHWTPGTIVMWDNRAVLHSGTGDHDPDTRHLVRICLASVHP
ncbi:TauD/TfdA family dioxygenase [Frankia sp. AiPs1]|uniref:TauD/TfdA dioxygenase family protein n=1 Tax=Frankia sp. AiPs1 TaxID=573493 RepID=UPI0020447120|nr:TauD/TfdA family dioxygenase [Frankia sp. AiPs1]MCM3925043.1 TauD/TfdA family dioxygenase [Frankia sp. AiPs1]